MKAEARCWDLITVSQCLCGRKPITRTITWSLQGCATAGSCKLELEAFAEPRVCGILAAKQNASPPPPPCARMLFQELSCSTSIISTCFSATVLTHGLPALCSFLGAPTQLNLHCFLGFSGASQALQMWVLNKWMCRGLRSQRGILPRGPDSPRKAVSDQGGGIPWC